MGNHRSVQHYHVYQPLQLSWQPAQNSEHLLVNRQTGELAELYTIGLNGSLEGELERYEYRFQQNQNLVRALHARPSE